MLEKLFNLFKRKQEIIRVKNGNELHGAKTSIVVWNVSKHSDPETIQRIYDHLKTAHSMRVLVTSHTIWYTAKTRKLGIVKGSCSKNNYSYFQFGVIKSGHRYDIYDDDRDNPIISKFYDWLKSIFKKFELEYENDINL